MQRASTRSGCRALVSLFQVAVLGMLVAACGSTSSAPQAGPGPSGRAGSITLTDARLPKPASPDVAVAYFTLTNSGDSADRLVQAGSSVSESAMPMKDVTQDGASTMVDVKGLTVPAGGSVVLSPGGTHLMLQQLTRTLDVGDIVTVRLRFSHAGSLTVQIPVTAMSGMTEPSGMASMSGM